MEISILESKVEQFLNEIKKINSKMRKNGFNPVIVNRLEDEYKEISEQYVKFAKFSVLGEFKFINGWELLGIVNLKNGLTIVKPVPGKEIPKRFWDTTPHCDHCQQKRNRNNVAILQKESEYKQVGLSCLGDFFPSVDIKTIEAAFKYHKIIHEICEHGDFDNIGKASSADIHYSVERILSKVSAVCRIEGRFITKSEAETSRSTSTSDKVISDLFSKKAEEYLATKDDHATASKIVKYVNTLEEDNSYLHNVKKIVESGNVNYNNIAILASAYYLYQKAKNLQNSESKDSNHIGQVGDKLKNLEVKVISVFKKDSTFGIVTIINFIDNQSNNLTWFASGRIDIDAGNEVLLSGTIKEHTVYKDVKKTIVTRCKLKTKD